MERLLQGWKAMPHAQLNANLNPLTSAKSVMSKLQNLVVTLVNMCIFQMTVM